MRIQVTHPVLRDFFDQLRFAPTDQKKKQLIAAEQLMMILNRDQDYPYDFIVYRITGYRPQSVLDQKLIPGKTLLSDLRVWIARTSKELEFSITEQTEPVFTVEELAERFSVSAKTIRRWQTRGLTGKIYLFQDGRKRKAFTESIVEQFFQNNPDLIRKAGKFTQLDKNQKQQIASLARELTSQKKYQTRNELILEIARRTGRVRETIRYVLAEYESEKGQKQALPVSRGKMTPKEMTQLCRLYQQGTSVTELMQRCHRSRSSVYRIINQQRARELSARKIEYIFSDEFQNNDVSQKILSVPLERLFPEKGSGTALLNRHQEAELFRRYNYLKFLAFQERTRIQRDCPRTSRLDQIEKLLKEADQVKKIIIESNMPLVVSIAGKHVSAGTPMNELVSEGSVALMAAVEKFDYSRGYRFSTYASWAIAKDFARMIPAEAKRLDRAGGVDFTNLPENLRFEQLPDVRAVEQAQQNLRTIIENNLDEREQFIILNHYALDTDVIKKKPKTLKQIGDELGLSKERIRQIELQALQKLRQSLSPEQFDLLTG